VLQDDGVPWRDQVDLVDRDPPSAIVREDRRSSPRAEENTAALVQHWTATGRGPVVLVRHDSRHTDSPLAAGSQGHELQEFLDADAADLLVVKDVNSAFYGTPDLRSWLDAAGIRDLVTCGIQTNQCVETTTRIGGNLGYRMVVALDATRTFDLVAEVPGAGQVHMTADELMRTTAVNLQGGGFATVLSTAEVIARGR